MRIVFGIVALFALPALAEDVMHEHKVKEVPLYVKPVNIRATLYHAPQLNAGNRAKIVIGLDKPDGSGMLLEDLQEIHTKPMHALIADAALGDVQHVHPKPGTNAGEYTFTFTPKTSNDHRLWVNVHPKDDDEQWLVMDLKGAKPKPAAPDTTENLGPVKLGNIAYALEFDEPLKVNNTSELSVIVSQNDEAFENLQPVMGTFAHIVAFYDDFYTVSHLNSTTAEVTSDKARGGPILTFRFTPERAGFVRLFAQFKISGKDVFVPFGVWVEE